jgi:hypothetical protein
MSDPLDPLLQAPAPERVHYATGVLLDAQDFLDEQTYHRGRQARVLDYLHGSGSAAGLRVWWARPLDPDELPDFPAGREEGLVIDPGIALDRLGRVIEIPRCHSIRLDVWYRGQETGDLIQALHPSPYGGVVADVFVRFVPRPRGKTPAFASGPFDATDAVVPSRLKDGFEATLVLRAEATADLPAKLPQNPWPDLAAVADIGARRQAMRDAILRAWHEGTAGWDEHGPVPLAEHAVGMDPTSVFLARVVIPAELPDGGGRPARTAADVRVDNDKRLFAYSTAALARWLGV